MGLKRCAKLQAASVGSVQLKIEFIFIKKLQKETQGGLERNVSKSSRAERAGWQLLACPLTAAAAELEVWRSLQLLLGGRKGCQSRAGGHALGL